jgi:hypothetical protein
MFPYNQQPTTTSHELGQRPEQLSPAQKAQLAESMNLTDRHFAEAAMAPGVLAEHKRQEAARLDTPLAAGWLEGLNHTTANEFVERVVIPEPSAVERANSQHIERITVLTPALAGVRRSPYTEQQLAGMTRSDFDLAL